MNPGVVKKGDSAPLGATLADGGVNFSVFSRNATRVELLLFDNEHAVKPATIIPLDPHRHRTYHYWHLFVPDLRPGQIYAYRAHGPFAPEHGFRFDGEKVLLDGRVNYWGYQPVSFFAPHHAYSSRKGPLAALDEFRDMVKALHRAGIEVILDVVFNHTTEGGSNGPTLCYRGLANDFYYILDKDKSRYADYTGCGNTLNANQPIVRRLIQDSLRYWVTQMHVDGFRLDLASAL